MSALKIKYSKSENSAVFAGNTFGAKDQIKSFGRAKWCGATKTWTVFDLVLPIEKVREELSSFSPVLDIDENEQPVEEAEQKGLSVSALSTSVKSVLDSHFSAPVLLFGRIQKVTRKAGRVFIDLADLDDASISLNCVIWSDEEKLCKELLSNGFGLEVDLQVMFQVRVDYFVKRGSLSLNIQRVIADYTISKLAAQRELTNKQLQKEGVYAKNKSLDFPFLPKRIGLLTSSAGTVLNDFLASLEVADFGFELFWKSVSVQGSEAKRSIVQGIENLEKVGDLDLILLFRGGGSVADLSVFNELDVARAVCDCSVPILSAIGHQEDQSSVQDVSFQAFGVPKDLGRFLADIIEEYRDGLLEFSSDISSSGVAEWEEAVGRVSVSLKFLQSEVQSKISLGQDRVCTLGRQLPEAATGVVSLNISSLSRAIGLLCELPLVSCRAAYQRLLGVPLVDRFSWYRRDVEQSLEKYELLLSEASPQKQLDRGFAIVKSSETNEVLTELSAGDRFKLELRDKRYTSLVENMDE